MSKKSLKSCMVTVFNREPGRLILECAVTVPINEWSKAETPELRFREDARATLRALKAAKKSTKKMPRQVVAFLDHLEAYLRSALRTKGHIQQVYQASDSLSPYPSAARMLREKVAEVIQ